MKLLVGYKLDMFYQQYHHGGEYPSKAYDITESLVIREDDISLVTQKNGDIPPGHEHGYGLYHKDCRFLSSYIIRLNGQVLTNILSSDEKQYASTVILTNRGFKDRRDVAVEKDTIVVRRDRVIPGVVDETIRINNYNRYEVKTDVLLEFRCDFYDIFTVRGLTKGTEGTYFPPLFHNNELTFSYLGKDGHTRSTTIMFDPAPSSVDRGWCKFDIALKPRGAHEIKIRVRAEEPGFELRKPVEETLKQIEVSYLSARDCCYKVSTDNEIFNKMLMRSVSDLRMLHMSLNGYNFYSAGVPWYDALFGRDSIIASIQSMLYEPGMAKSTLELLALYQAKGFDDWRDAEPGKILHELRIGEKANLNEIPQTPYYGSVDSTPLFLILLAEYIDWTGDTGIMSSLEGSIRSALEWLEKYSDPGGMGIVSYSGRSSRGLYNQGWKDSFESISHSDGSLAEKPIAPAEVQGYTYMARERISHILEKLGRNNEAKKLRGEAECLKRDFNERFWMASKRYYAQAIDRNGLCDVISSNPLLCLWGEIVDKKHAEDVVRRAFEPDMFTGWGIRTLSSSEERYNPLGYHIGTLWPFDNSIITKGLCKYGFKDEAALLFNGMYDAAGYYHDYRIPELFGGFQREKQNRPIKYPIACNPQAWSAGTIPFMLMSMLGITPDALNNRLIVARPELPSWLEKVKIRDLSVGGKSIDIDFRREGSATTVDIIRIEGIEVDVRY
jgi:glycogen debranching enzyme